MKASVFALLFGASALATPVVTRRQLEPQADAIDKLLEVVKGHTAKINKTIAAVQQNPTADQQNAAAAAIAPEFQAITDALKSAASNFVGKRGLPLPISLPNVAGAPQVVNTVPKVSVSVPEVLSNVPDVLGAVPKVPQVAGAVPQVANIVPGVAGAVPKVVDNVPNVVSNVPGAADAATGTAASTLSQRRRGLPLPVGVPDVAGTVSNLPVVANVVPQLAGNVPVVGDVASTAAGVPELAAGSVPAVTKVTDDANVPAVVSGAEGVAASCPHDCLLGKIQLLVWEIAFTLKAVIFKIGLPCVIANVKPLLFALVGLVKGLDKIVVGVVVVVKGLLTGVLGALCGSVLDILF